MGEINKFEQMLSSLKHTVLCFFGQHEFDVYEVLTHGPFGPGESSFYVSCCPWCGKMQYGAKDTE